MVGSMGSITDLRYTRWRQQSIISFEQTICKWKLLQLFFLHNNLPRMLNTVNMLRPRPELKGCRRLKDNEAINPCL